MGENKLTKYSMLKILKFSLRKSRRLHFLCSKGVIFPFESVRRCINWTETVCTWLYLTQYVPPVRGFLLFRCALPIDGTLQESYYVLR